MIDPGKGAATKEWGFATTDDHQPSTWEKGQPVTAQTVLTYHQAVQEALRQAGADHSKDGAATVDDKPVTVGDAVSVLYKRHLEKHGGELKNVDRVEFRLEQAKGFRHIEVAKLTAQSFEAWDDAFKGLSKSTWNRENNCLRKALNLAAERDSRITNTRLWAGRNAQLKKIKNADQSRNVILKDATVKAIVKAAYGISPEFGLYVEVVAQTGARPSQAIRQTVRDVKYSKPMMPVSNKGNTEKANTHHKVAMTADLLRRLPTKNRPDHATLLTKADGTSWEMNDQIRLFKRIIDETDLKNDPDITGQQFPVTMYALRHSSIVRMLLKNVDLKTVATLHDTSVKMIEKHYAAYISDHTDAVAASLAMFEDKSKVVTLPKAA
jgi:integrase